MQTDKEHICTLPDRVNFICPDCGTGMRCYYEGNDCYCGTKDICKRCYLQNHKFHDYLKQTKGENDG